MISLLVLCIKALYWLLIGWWLKPIQYLKNRKITKMQNEIIKYNYNQIKEEEKQQEQQ